MRRFVVVAALLLAGCLKPTAPDGTLTCSTVPGRACPMGYYCEKVSNSCWIDGDGPDMTGMYPPGTDLAYPHFGPLVQDLSGTAPPDDMAAPNPAGDD
jgi:hypothetical protein